MPSKPFKTLSIDLETHRKIKHLSTDFGVSVKETMARAIAIIYNLSDEQKEVIKRMSQISNGR